MINWINRLFFFNFIFKLYNIVLVLPNIEMNPPRYTRVPHPEPSPLLRPHTLPLGRPSAPAPSIQYHASNLDWRLVSYMILYMFQCHSPKSPTLSLSHRVHNITHYQRNANQNHYEVLFHASQNGCNPKVYK